MRRQRCRIRQPFFRLAQYGIKTIDRAMASRSLVLHKAATRLPGWTGCAARFLSRESSQDQKEANMNPTQFVVALIASPLFFNSSAIAQENQSGAAAKQAVQLEAGAKPEFSIRRVTPQYWRVTIDHPPFNIFGPESIPQLNSVITQIENDPELRNPNKMSRRGC
jgi:hypothetical protein